MRTGPDRAALEVGCGMGRLTYALADHFGSVLGLDVSPQALARAEAANDRANVRFELTDGRRLRPSRPGPWDAVFSYEVFHYLELETVAAYVRDTFALLRPGGQLVFECNVRPIRLHTAAAGLLRRALHALGRDEWRGWPTAPEFRRVAHSADFLRRVLTEAGFAPDRILTENPIQAWFVASKPV